MRGILIEQKVRGNSYYGWGMGKKHCFCSVLSLLDHGVAGILQGSALIMLWRSLHHCVHLGFALWFGVFFPDFMDVSECLVV